MNNQAQKQHNWVYIDLNSRPHLRKVSHIGRTGLVSWFGKQKKHDPLPAVALEEKPKPDPEKQLSTALSEYEKHFYDKVRGAPDQHAEEARKSCRGSSEVRF